MYNYSWVRNNINKKESSPAGKKVKGTNGTKVQLEAVVLSVDAPYSPETLMPL